MKGQISLEYIAILVLILFFITPIWLHSMNVQYQSTTQMSLSYAKLAAERVADAADFIYSQGPPASIRLMVYIPSGVESSNITNNTILFKLRYGNKLSDVFATSTAPLNGSLPVNEGNYRIIIEANDTYVQINY